MSVSMCLSLWDTQTHAHTHTCLQTTSRAPDCPTCPLTDHQRLMDQCLPECSGPKSEDSMKMKAKSFYFHVCECVALPCEQNTSHKIQLWKNKRSLFTTDNSDTHRHLRGSEPSVVTHYSFSPVCMSVNVTYPQVKLLCSECVCVRWFLWVCGWIFSLSVRNNVSLKKFHLQKTTELLTQKGGKKAFKPFKALIQWDRIFSFISVHFLWI